MAVPGSCAEDVNETRHAGSSKQNDGITRRDEQQIDAGLTQRKPAQRLAKLPVGSTG
jgi:hypothetical protein